MKGTYRTILVVFLLSVVSSVVWTQSEKTGADALRQGVILYKDGEYHDAVLAFREIILDATMEPFHGEAYFWVAKTYLATGELDPAEKNLEFFLINYKNSPYYPEGFYQKGRLLFTQGEYEKAIQVFYNFLTLYKDNPFAPNCYYWIGETLYKLGHLEEAHTVFNKVITEYPESYKLEAAKFRASLIELKYRENELLELIKISHEEYLKSLDEFQKREKTYQQAIEAYQKKLTSMTTDQVKEMIADLNQQIEDKNSMIAEIQVENDEMEAVIEEYKKRLTEMEARITESVADGGTEQQAVPPTSTDNQSELLKIKAEALDLKAYYLKKIYSSEEGAE